MKPEVALDTWLDGLVATRLAILHDVLDDLGHHLHDLKRRSARQRHEPDESCLLELVGLDRDEIAHSKLLAWLLDETAAHGLGERLLVELLREGHLLDGFPGGAFRVRREAWGSSYRADILIDGDRFVVAIENKIDAPLQPQQLHRMLKDTRLMANQRWHRLIYLALSDVDDRPAGIEYVSYNNLLTALQRCRDDAAPSAQRIIDEIAYHVLFHLLPRGTRYAMA